MEFRLKVNEHGVWVIQDYQEEHTKLVDLEASFRWIRNRVSSEIIRQERYLKELKGQVG